MRRATLSVGYHPDGLDNSSWNRFRLGKLEAQRTLDLHGRTAQRAYHALLSFIVAAHADRVRCIEVITGRGTGEGGGVIRRELPMWLNLPALRPLVLAASHPHPSNPGSVRLLLRRAK
jgi:DNA-nicking Smr family endonuclease